MTRPENDYKETVIALQVLGFTVPLTIFANSDENVFDVQPVSKADAPHLDFFVKVRRVDKHTNEPREHDFRMVRSSATWPTGTIRIEFEASDLFMSVRELAMAAGTIALRRRVDSISIMDKEVIGHAIRYA